MAPQYVAVKVTRVNDNVPREADQTSPGWGRAISVSWVLGAVGSLALGAWHLPYALFVDAVSSGWPMLYGVIVVLVVQAALCGAWSRWWRQIPARFLLGAVVVFLAAHAVVASVAWPPLGHALWMLWIGPVPMLIPAAVHLGVVSAMRMRPTL